MGEAPDEPVEILVLLIMGAIFMGTALTIRDLIGERAVFRREQAVGLSATAYLLAKIWVYCTAAIVQSVILVTIVIYGKGRPTQGDVVLGNPTVELFVSVAGTCITGAILGWCCLRWPAPTTRSCRCWWCWSFRSWCSAAA